jgi:acyl phosphate:glycerol-3-phosphate acyltransferase
MSPWFYTIPAGFLAGTIPFGLLIGKAKGVDIRTIGSGNIGATNLGRAFGRRYFFLCFVFDFLKGFAPVLTAGWLAGLLDSASTSPTDAWLWVAAMLAPVLGHVLNPWLGFKGGKGVATSLGALLAVWPHLSLPGVGVFLVFLLCLKLTRYMSLSSMLGSVTLPLFAAGIWAYRNSPAWATGQPSAKQFQSVLPFLTVACFIPALVIWTHRANLRRLRAGTEPRIGQRVSAK